MRERLSLGVDPYNTGHSSPARLEYRTIPARPVNSLRFESNPTMGHELERMHAALERAPVAKAEEASGVCQDLATWGQAHPDGPISPAGRQALDWIVARAKRAIRTGG